MNFSVIPYGEKGINVTEISKKSGKEKTVMLGRAIIRKWVGVSSG